MAAPSFLAARFPALLSKNFRRLLLGQVISAAGSQMQFAALNWQVYDITGDAAALGAIGLVRVVPILIFSLIGGAMADTRDRRKLLLVTQTCLALVAVALGFLALKGWTSVTSIYLLTALGAAAIAFDNPSRQALVPSLVPREHLPNAFALNSTGFQVATIAGPVLAGLTLKYFGAGWAYLLNAASFLAVIAALLLLPPQKPAPTADGEAVTGGGVSLESLREGMRFVFGTPILVATMALDFFATFFSSATALLPIFARDVLHVGPEGYGLLGAFPAAGSLLAGITLSLLPPMRRTGLVIITAACVYGLATAGFGFSTVFWVSALFLGITGASDTVSTVLRQTIRQTVTPDHLRGRMVSVNMIFFMGGPQLGELEAGLVARWLGPLVSVVSGGVACVASVALVVGRFPWLLRYRLEDARESEPQRPAA